MTTFDRFDPFERRIGDALEGLAPPRPLDYLDDTFRQTAGTAQRPRWSFPERWLNVDTTFPRPFPGRRLPMRQVVALALLLALVAAAVAFYAGAFPRLPPPTGIAANGQIVFGLEGDLYIRDSIDGTSRLLLAGPSDQGGVVVSPDGQLIAYDNVEDGVDHAWVAEIDGSNPRQILDRPFTGLAFQWKYDSTAALAVTDSAGFQELWIAPADGSGAREIELENLWPFEATWDPTRPDVALVRTSDRRNGDVDMYYVDTTTGAILSKIDLTGANLYGPTYEFAGMAFSPDGQTIAYNVVESDVSGGEHFWLHLINRDGTNDRLVPLPPGAPPGYSQAWAVFSPDGRTIAMESWSWPTDTSLNQLALAPVDGSSPTRLVGPQAQNRSVVKVWSPDGAQVLVHIDGLDEVYLVDPITGEHESMPWKSDFPNWQRVAP